MTRLLLSLALVGLVLFPGSSGNPRGRRPGRMRRPDAAGGGMSPPENGERRERPDPVFCRLDVNSGVEGEEPVVAFSEPCAGEDEECAGGPSSSPGGLAQAFFCRRQRPPTLHDLICLAEIEGMENRTQDCGQDIDCDVGPVVIPLPDGMANVKLTLCDDQEALTTMACSILGGDGLPRKEGDCPVDVPCDVGPVPVQFEGEDAAAFFCRPPMDGGRGGHDGGRRGGGQRDGERDGERDSERDSERDGEDDGGEEGAPLTDGGEGNPAPPPPPPPADGSQTGQGGGRRRPPPPPPARRGDDQGMARRGRGH